MKLRSQAPTTLRPAASRLNLPSGIAPRKNNFDASRSIYNLKASNSRRSRGKIAAARAGATRTKIALAGHSLIAGLGATPGVDDARTHLVNTAKAQGYPIAGTGYVPTANNVSTSAAPYNFPFDARWVLDTGYNGVAGNMFSYFNASGKKYTFTADYDGTTVELFYTNNSAPFTYSINGGGAVTVTPPGGTSLAKSVLAVSLAAGQTLVVTTTSTSTTFLVGVNVHKATGLEFSSVGVSGSTAAMWAPTYAGASAWFNHYNILTTNVSPDICILQLDHNEWISGSATPAQYKTNMATVIAALQALNVDVKLVRSASPVPGLTSSFPAITQATWDGYGNALYDLADTYDVPLLDLSDRLGAPWAGGTNPYGLMYDQVHERGAGQAENAVGMWQLLGVA